DFQHFSNKNDYRKIVVWRRVPEYVRTLIKRKAEFRCGVNLLFAPAHGQRDPSPVLDLGYARKGKSTRYAGGLLFTIKHI
ncbi:MAG: hypothetical protein IKP68_04855, partial [Clostridia bacterium]|nr:hypothetical protein [Clostridia bacterium]